MAKHRINVNGHLMWFDSDEEYYEYLAQVRQARENLEKANRIRRRKKIRNWTTTIICIFIIMFLAVGKVKPIWIIVITALIGFAMIKLFNKILKL